MRMQQPSPTFSVSYLELEKCVAHGQLGEGGIVDPASERVLLELQQLDDQARQGLAGRGVVLDVLGGGKEGRWLQNIHDRPSRFWQHRSIQVVPQNWGDGLGWGGGRPGGSAVVGGGHAQHALKCWDEQEAA